MRKEQDEVKLFCGLIFSGIETLRKASEKLVRAFGPIEAESDVYPFDHTDYYRSEMGGDLMRKFIAFEQLIPPRKLIEAKIKANQIEKQLFVEIGEELHRRINIDPGYLELSKIVLASTKNYSHRIYLDKGIFAEVTMIRRGNRYRFLQWTYPDYVHPSAMKFFEESRILLKNQISG